MSSQRQFQTLSLPNFRILYCGKNNFSSTVQQYLNIFGFKLILIFILCFCPHRQNHKVGTFLIDYYSIVHDFGCGVSSCSIIWIRQLIARMHEEFVFSINRGIDRSN